MELSGLHLLLTYQCTFECDHCFVWGSPWQSGTMRLEDIRSILSQAREAGTVKSIYFEGGEPMLYYPILLRGVTLAAQQGFEVGIVSNAYWATSVEDAEAWLEPLAGKISDLTVSSDLFHYSELISRQAQNATQAAQNLGIPVGMISVAQPQVEGEPGVVGQLPEGESDVMYRGRAAIKLAGRAALKAWEQFDSCPHEDLRDPGRVHVDPLGNLHICQGITMGNMLQKSLKQICDEYDPDSNPVVGPLLSGGPAELVRRYNLPHDEAYADACHLCYMARQALRRQFPAILLPDQMYGVMDGSEQVV
ncbi:MAG: radical SAM protein [Anaerolineales bacterium]|nr:radical SAM protein [Anaerolineales bacterium]